MNIVRTTEVQVSKADLLRALKTLHPRDMVIQGLAETADMAPFGNGVKFTATVNAMVHEPAPLVPGMPGTL